MKYFEIITKVGVIGVCTLRDLMNVMAEDIVLLFGEITKEQYDDFCAGASWSESISTVRYVPKVKPFIELSPSATMPHDLKTLLIDTTNPML